MKNIAAMSLFVLPAIIQCAVSAFNSHPEMSAASVGKVADYIYHHVQKRQTSANSDLTQQDILDCNTAIYNHQCGSSGYAQQVANIALGCRNDSYARTVADACAKNANGDFCDATTSAFILDQSQSTNAYTCVGAVSSGVCPSTCRSFLQSGKSKLGCCINTYVNKTTSPLYATYSVYVDYRLWNLCNVALPQSDCGNSLPLNPPAITQTCTVNQLFSQLVQYECMASVGQPLVDAILRNRRCYSYARLQADACGINANGQYCGEVIGMDLLDSASTSTNTLLATLRSSCYSHDTCSFSCRLAINNIKNAYGCCVNIYNDSDSFWQFQSLSYGVWNACGVDSPGFCSSTLSGSITHMKAFAWVIAAALAVSFMWM